MTERLWSIEVDEYLPHPCGRAWEALVDPAQLNAWFTATDFEPVEGRAFTLDTGQWGTTYCRVLEVDPPQSLRYSWRNGDLDTEVSWRCVEGPDP